MDFWEELRAYHGREEEKKWEGTFREYLNLVIDNPRVARSAHTRLYDVILEKGVGGEGNDKTYAFFEGKIFGLEDVLQHLVEDYLRPAARRLDVRRRILVLVGPVGSGKSTIVELLKRGLEEYSRSDGGALYAIRDCPMGEEPLHLIPRELRPEFHRRYGILVEGDLCPRCRMMVEEVYKGRIEEVPVQRVFISEQDRRGIGTFSPSDPKSQDIAELTGSIDFSTIGEYGSESDPRAFRFDGELNVANRGLMEFRELFKCDERFLYNLLSLSQEGQIKAGRFALISADEVVIAHSNIPEYRSFVENPRNEALRSRLFVILVPYNLRVSEEVKIYAKLIRESEVRVHVAPYSLWVAAVFAVLTRLRESKKQGVSLAIKMRLYDGERIEGFSQRDVADLKSEARDEGTTGIDPRYVFNCLSAAAAAQESGCLTPREVLRHLKRGLSRYPGIKNEERERYLNLLALAYKEYVRVLTRDLRRVVLAVFRGSACQLFSEYIRQVEAFVHEKRVTNPLTGEETAPDEELMRSVEEEIGVSEVGKKIFREELMAWVIARRREGQGLDFSSHSRLAEAIEKKFFAELKRTLKFGLGGTDVVKGGHVEEVIKELVANHGCCSICARDMVRQGLTFLSR